MLFRSLHETGHLIGGLLTGYKFCSFRIGNLQLQRENGALRFRRLKLAGTGGQCLMTPPEPVDGKIPVMLYNLAGPLMNLLAALLALGGYFLSGGGSVGASLLFLFAFAGLYLALTNGIPLRLGPIDNDGKNAFSLRRDPEAMRAFYLQMSVNSRQTEGERLRDMPDEWFVMPSDEAMQNALVAATGVFCCSRLMDEHRFAEAHEAMSRLLSGGANLVGLYRALLLCDEMYLELLGENRRGTVDAMLTKPQCRFMRQMKDFPSVLRTEYALALLHDGDKSAPPCCAAGLKRTLRPTRIGVRSSRSARFSRSRTGKFTISDKENAMSQVTKRALEQSLKNLLLKKPLTKITINDIAEDCGINRMTFYYHFKDIYDLVEWSCLEDARRALEEKKTHDTWQQGLLQIFEAVRENKPFILNVYRCVDREQVERYLRPLVDHLILGVIDEQSAAMTVRDEDKAFIAQVYGYIFIAIMLDWTRDGMTEEPEKIVDRLALLIHDSIREALARFKI